MLLQRSRLRHPVSGWRSGTVPGFLSRRRDDDPRTSADSTVTTSLRPTSTVSVTTSTSRRPWAPPWVDDPLDEYYLYFADHGGESVRLAYADDLTGPWTLHGPAPLGLAEAGEGFDDHVTPPDVLPRLL